MLNLNQGLALFKQTQTLSRDKNLQTYFFEPQTKLNFSSSNTKNFYVLTSKTITDKCNVAKDLRKLCQQGFLSTRFPLPTLTKLII